jgi:phage-related protein
MKSKITLWNTSNDTLSFANGHLLYDGAKVRVSGTLPTGASNAVAYYVRTVGLTELKLFNTLANALNRSTETGLLNATGSNSTNAFIDTTTHVQTLLESPSQASRGSVKPRIRTVQFGDGYRQSSPDGINNRPLSYRLQYNRISQRRALNVINLFHDLGGHRYFYWTPPPPYVAPLKFVCEDYEFDLEGPNIYSVSAKIDQVFDI